MLSQELVSISPIHGVDITMEESLKVEFYPPSYSSQTWESRVTLDGPIRYIALSAGMTKKVGC